MPELSNGSQVGPFTIDSFVKLGAVNETYRVTRTGDDSHHALFMKLFIPSMFPSQMNRRDGSVAEIELCRGLAHPAVISYVADGVYTDGEGKTYPYIVSNYFSGRLLSEMLGYGSTPFTVDDVADIYRKTLQGLAHLHGCGLVHNDITPRNVMYDPATREIQIIDMGHVARAKSPEHSYETTDFEPFYRSPEGFRNANDPVGDIFAASAVAYALIAGHAPWYDADIEAETDEWKQKTSIHMARKKPLNFDGLSLDVPEWLRYAISGGLAVKAADRLDADTILQILDTRETPAAPADDEPEAADTPLKAKPEPPSPGLRKNAEEGPAGTVGEDAKVKKGNGFADVAGMDDLKDLLQKKVLFILKDKEKARRYRLTPPNGMLLYGPPGCGKTYFAEKFAEESGFNYKFIKASDLGSIYIHGGQGKIAELFNKARQQAPVIICFDEFDAMVPDRSSRGGEHIAGEVNEFLTQLNNCSKDGIFVIGTTNQPEMIDRAILRKGRLDISVYIPEPDTDTRRRMFDLYLKDRPCDPIDTQRLADLTDKYVAADIAFIVNDAAMIAAFRDEPITQAGLESSIKSTRPSLTDSMLRDYARSRAKLENRSRVEDRPRVGFMQYGE